MNIWEFMELSAYDMYRFVWDMTDDRLGNLHTVLGLKGDTSPVADHENFGVAVQLVLKRIAEIEYKVAAEYSKRETEKAALHHLLNFTNEDGDSVIGWGRGSKLARKIVNGEDVELD